MKCLAHLLSNTMLKKTTKYRVFLHATLTQITSFCGCHSLLVKCLEVGEFVFRKFAFSKIDTAIN